MPKINSLKILLCFFLHLSCYGYAQDFADPEFYLIDSLRVNNISAYDKIIIDSCLTEYHKSTDDTVKLAFVHTIVDKCWDPEVWPKYNRFMISESRKKLAVTQNKAVRDKLIYFIAGGISNIGFLYDERGNLLRALDYYHQGLTLYEKISNKEGIATTYNNLGVIYSIIGDTARALDYHHKSLQFKKEIRDIEGVAMSYNNIGTIYENVNAPFKALEYYEVSLKLREEINDLRGIAMCYDNIGDIYYSEEIYGKAHQYYQKAYEIWESVGIDVGLSTSMNNLANVLLQMGNNEQAKQYGLASLRVAEELGFPVDIENSARTLMNIYRAEGNYKEALRYTDIYLEMKEKIKSDEGAKTILKKTMQYEYEKLALQDSLERAKEREVHQLKLKEKETQNYALFGGMGLLCVILLIGIRSYQQKKKDNRKINEQKREVESQKSEIEKQHIALAATHKEISDSISYAKRIQDAILPSENILDAHLEDSFVFFQPNDVVSGDFYWMVDNGDHVLLAVADCTGHGVPGAMVSVVCHNALNRVVREFDVTEPAQILNKTRQIVVDTFATHQGNVKDGMDISLCKWNKHTNQLQWSGANNPLYIIRKENPSNVEIILPDKQPIGNFEKAKNFKNHSLELQKGDTFYLFSDGFMDQFGGSDGKKYKYSRFRELLVQHFHSDLKQQGEHVKRAFEDWKGSLEQLDDVCVIGVRI